VSTRKWRRDSERVALQLRLFRRVSRKPFAASPLKNFDLGISVQRCPGEGMQISMGLRSLGAAEQGVSSGS
jgi:hypothetical protein